MTVRLAGILPVLPTPFQLSGDVDALAMRRLVRFAVEAGVGGVVFPGFASEVEHLSAAEREELLTVVVDEVAGAVPVIAGASAASPDQVVAHGAVAGRLGIRHLMVQPPKSVGAGAREVGTFLAAVANSLPEMELVLQNAPAPRGSDLSADAIVEIVAALPGISYVKEETLPAGPAITHVLSQAPAHLKGVIGGGGARYILDEYERGACAAMPALEIADEHVRLDVAWRNGDEEGARRIYERTLPLLTLQAVYRMRLTKHVLMSRGILSNAEVRAPTPVMDGFATADVDANLERLGLAVAPGAQVA